MEFNNSQAPKPTSSSASSVGRSWRHRCCCPATNFALISDAFKSAKERATRDTRANDMPATAHVNNGEVILTQPGLSNGCAIHYSAVNGSVFNIKPCELDAREFDEIDLGDVAPVTLPTTAADALALNAPEKTRTPSASTTVTASSGVGTLSAGGASIKASGDAEMNINARDIRAKKTNPEHGIETVVSAKDKKIAERIIDEMLSDFIHERFESIEELPQVMEEDLSKVDFTTVTEAIPGKIQSSRNNNDETVSVSTITISPPDSMRSGKKSPEKPPRAIFFSANENDNFYKNTVHEKNIVEKEFTVSKVEMDKQLNTMNNEIEGAVESNMERAKSTNFEIVTKLEVRLNLAFTPDESSADEEEAERENSSSLSDHKNRVQDPLGAQHLAKYGGFIAASPQPPMSDRGTKMYGQLKSDESSDEDVNEADDPHGPNLPNREEDNAEYERLKNKTSEPASSTPRTKSNLKAQIKAEKGINIF